MDISLLVCGRVSQDFLSHKCSLFSDSPRASQSQVLGIVSRWNLATTLQNKNYRMSFFAEASLPHQAVTLSQIFALDIRLGGGMGLSPS
jgi:hypothetical protein